jgi:hypothetical protein
MRGGPWRVTISVLAAGRWKLTGGGNKMLTVFWAGAFGLFLTALSFMFYDFVKKG